VKLYSIAQELYRQGCANLDIEDMRLLKSQIEKARTLMVIAKAPILMKIDEALDKAKTKPKEEELNGGKAG
jgi:hypothetical protein